MANQKLLSYTSSLLGLSTKIANEHLLLEAFTHKSYAIEHPEVIAHNQRLEFLGDSVLGLVVAGELYKDHPDFDEAQLTLWKISLVREENLFEVAKEIGLDQIILIWKGEERKKQVEIILRF